MTGAWSKGHRLLTLRKLVATSLVIGGLLAGTAAPSGQGRCIRAFGAPGCDTTPIAPVFVRTGWRTTALEHITFRVAEPQKEAAFYAALMGWHVRTVDDTRVVMDVGDWGTVIFRGAPLDSFAAPVQAAGPPPAVPIRAVVEGVGFVIEPWDARIVAEELRRRGLNPVADNSGGGFESFHIKDPDGFDVQVSNSRGYSMSRSVTKGAASLRTPAPFGPTGWQTVWLDHFSYNASDYKTSASFYMNLLGWGPTYDEGSQNELMIGDVGDIIVRGGNRLDPDFGRTPNPRAGRARIDHISFGIAPWDTDSVRAALEERGLNVRVDTSDGAEIHLAQYKSYHTTTPNGYDLQISYNTHDTRLNLAIAVNPRRPGVK